MMDLRGRIAADQVFENISSREAAAQTRDRLARLIRRIGVGEREDQIRRCVELVCGGSLGAGWSSLNADGSPMQFALSLSRGRRPGFEFVGEAFRTGMEYPGRRAFGLQVVAQLAEVIGLEAESEAVRHHLETLTDSGPAQDCEDPAGAFWIGAAFEASGTASITIYANARRGEKDARWKRLARFAESITNAEWAQIFSVAERSALSPLGAGVRISRRGSPHVRVYFGAYGVKPEDCRRIFREAGGGEPFDGTLAVFFEETMAAEATLPTGSAVFSWGARGDKRWWPKLELCGHCAWKSDREATGRCGKWLDRLGVDAALYRDAAEILTADREEPQGVHAYVGVGMKQDDPYASIYLNPGSSGL